MDTFRIALASIAVAALAAFPSAALAGTVVPPGNSAANQYTETFPTAGGNTEAKKGKGKVTPAQVLGAHNAKKLDSQGKQGREAAAVVAATAPAPIVAGGEGVSEESGSATGAAKGNGGSGGSGGSAAAGGGAAGGRAAGGGGTTTGTGTAPDHGGSGAEEPSGSSGFGEVLGQATGSTSSGGTGLLLPLVVLATVAWALAFLLRRKRRTA